MTCHNTSITTTLPQFGQFLTGNRFAEGKGTKVSSMWAGRYEEVLKVLFLRSVVVILGAAPRTVKDSELGHNSNYQAFWHSRLA